MRRRAAAARRANDRARRQREAGVDVPFSCEQGICGACETRVIDGDVDHRDSILTDSERAANKTMMICVSRCRSQRLVLDA